MYRILVVEDDIRINEVICDFLRKNNMEVICAFDGKEGYQKFNEEKIDLMIIDIMMPKMDGFELARRVREKSNTPIIVLSARDSQEDQLRGYDIEIDDYLTKPFNPEMVVVKVKNLLKRIKTYKGDTDGDTYEMDGFCIDFVGRSVSVQGEYIELERKQFDILQYLIENKNNALTRDQILDRVWGHDYFGRDRVVDTQVKKLRKALGLKAHLIKTVFSVGYTFQEKRR